MTGLRTHKHHYQIDDGPYFPSPARIWFKCSTPAEDFDVCPKPYLIVTKHRLYRALTGQSEQWADYCSGRHWK